MPINPNALSSPEPDENAQEKQDASQYVAEVQQREEQEQPTRRRRKKSEMIADAVVPAADEQIEVKDSDSGAKVQRTWSDAVALVKAEKAEFVDRAHHYAMLKADQQATASAFAPENTQVQDVRYDPKQTSHMVKTDEFVDPHGTPYVRIADIHGSHEGSMTLEEWNTLSIDAPDQTPPPATDASGQMVAPEGSEHGDEVVVGSKTYYVGPGGVLVDDVVDAPAKRRWQRELGAGENGSWESKEIVHPGAFSQRAVEITEAVRNGDGPKELDIQTERLPRTVEPVDGDDGVLKWKIGNGILEKIGMPDYSSFQIGPISISRMVIDDGRRTVVPLRDGREGEVPTAVIEAFETIDNTVEFIAARFRGQLMSFFQATGAIQQPVS